MLPPRKINEPPTPADLLVVPCLWYVQTSISPSVVAMFGEPNFSNTSVCVVTPFWRCNWTLPCVIPELRLYSLLAVLHELRKTSNNKRIEEQ